MCKNLYGVDYNKGMCFRVKKKLNYAHQLKLLLGSVFDMQFFLCVALEFTCDGEVKNEMKEYFANN